MGKSEAVLLIKISWNLFVTTAAFSGCIFKDLIDRIEYATMASKSKVKG